MTLKRDLPPTARWTVEVWSAPARNVFNVFCHPWVFREINPARPRQAVDIQVGAYEPMVGVGVAGCKKPLRVEGMGPTRVSVHVRQGGMALSPNNAQLALLPGAAPLRSFWLGHRHEGFAHGSLVFIVTEDEVTRNLHQLVGKLGANVDGSPFRDLVSGVRDIKGLEAFAKAVRDLVPEQP